MSDTTLRYYAVTMAFVPRKTHRRIQHARKMLRLHTSRRKFKQSVRNVLSHLF
ncbi:MAG: hypothetical protein AAB429_01225 [Patescibacteria group bacterium]